MSSNNINRYAIILCGGFGSRLWPLSRELRPKQFLTLNGNESLLQQTAKRLTKLVSQDHLYLVTHENHKFEVKAQLTENYPNTIQNILTEPETRNTLPAIAWATYQIYKKNQGAVIGVFASDHAIKNEKAFLNGWQSAEKAAAENFLVLLGIKPDKPLTGYGYIKPGKIIELNSDLPIHKVSKFIEKPNQKNAQQFIKAGYLWNSGMFVFKAESFLNMLKKYQPIIYEHLIKLTKKNFGECYARFPNLSIDYGLAEKVDKLAVVPVDMGWNDLGNWSSIYTNLEKDNNKNACFGNVFNLDTKNSLIWSENGIVTTFGLNNIIVIQTSDVTLICDRQRSDDIKLLVSEIKKKHPLLTEIHQTVSRPWGNYTILEESHYFKIKRIVVNPGKKLSLQMHYHRSEHWIVVSGVATIDNNGNVYKLNENQSTYIPIAHRHRLSNDTENILVIIEVQCGSYVGEDDIVRFDDDYGRTIHG